MLSLRKKIYKKINKINKSLNKERGFNLMKNRRTK